MTRTGLAIAFRALRRRTAKPLASQIADIVTQDVRAGRFVKGERLPGARALAEAFGVDRDTVDAAIDDMVAQGVLERRERVGTFVLWDVAVAPAPSATRPRTKDRPGFSVRKAVPVDEPDDAALDHNTIAWWGGSPDTTVFPRRALAQAVRDILLHRRSAKNLSYGSPLGHPQLRRAVARLLSEHRGLVTTTNDVMITSGSQMGIDLCARALCQPGDVVAIENPGYPPARAAFVAAGAKLVGIPVDGDGFNVDAFAKQLRRTRFRAVVLTPHHQYPTTVQLSLARRAALLALCAQHRICLIEDDYDPSFQFEGVAPPPLAASDTENVVVHIGTFSKVLAPALRVGHVRASRAVLAALAEARHSSDRQGNSVMEAALAHILDDGVVAQHARRMRRLLRARRDWLTDTLKHELGDVLRFDVPRGGTALWLEVDSTTDVNAWRERAAQRGLLLQNTQTLFWPNEVKPYLRVGFAQPESVLREAVKRLLQAKPRRRSARTSVHALSSVGGKATEC